MVVQNNNGDLIIEIKDFSASEVYKSEPVRVEIKQEDFLQIKETLQRIGMYSKKTNTLYQTAHILHKKGFYYILHFKELFSIDGKLVNFSPEDEVRRNFIAALLEKWGLLKIVDPSKVSEERKMMERGQLPPYMRVLKHSERGTINLETKYVMGVKK